MYVFTGMPTAESVRDAFAQHALEVTGIHVIPSSESKYAHLVVILSAGIRVYLSLKDDANDAFGSANGGVGARVPVAVHISHVRSPPAGDIIRSLSTPSMSASTASTPGGVSQSVSGDRNIYSNTPYRPTPGNTVTPGGGRGSVWMSPDGVGVGSAVPYVRDNGSVPKYAVNESLHVYSSYYNQHMLLLAESNPGAAGSTGRDVLIAITEDLITRTTANPMMGNGMGLFPGNNNPQLPGLRENISVLSHHGVGSMGGKVYDIKDVCNDLYSREASVLHQLILYSKSPATAPIRSCSKATSTTTTINNNTTIVPNYNVYVGTSTSALSYLGREGTNPSNFVTSVPVPLSELTWQSSPTITPISEKRYLLCLTNQGLHLLSKSRPIDYLYGMFMNPETPGNESVWVDQLKIFFNNYGTVQSSAMCIAIACGIPFDMGCSPGKNTPVDGLLSNKIMLTLFKLTEGPVYATVTRPAVNTSSIFDSRITTLHNTTGNNTKSFRYSSVHDGLVLFICRILRPIWFKAVVEKNSLATHLTPAIIKCIKDTLTKVLGILKEYFGTVLTRNVDSTQVSSLALTNGATATAATATGGVASNEYMEEEERLIIEAQRLEELSLNTLARLLSRSIQGLTLLSILHETLQSPDVKRVNSAQIWSRFHGLDMFSFICSAEAHQRIKISIREISDQLVLHHQGAHVCELFIQKLVSQCYLYYSSADKLSFDSLKLLSKLQILTCHDTSEIVYCIENSCALLLQQAMFWDSLEDVMDAQGGGMSNSNLWVYCNKLRYCGMNIPISQVNTAAKNYQMVLETIMDMCVITSNHFYGCIVPNSAVHYTMTKHYPAALAFHR